MSALIRKFLTSNLKTITNCTLKRNIYSESALGIDLFKQAQEEAFGRNNEQLGDVRKRVAGQINSTDEQINMLDLKVLLYSGKTSDDYNFLIQAFKKMVTHEPKPNFAFGPQIARGLYSINSINKVIECIKDEIMGTHFVKQSVLTMVVNKLVAEKRYDEAFDIYKFASTHKDLIEPNNKLAKLSTDLSSLVVEGLFRKNTKDALEKLKEVMVMVKETGRQLTREGIISAILLALNQGDVQLASEYLALIKNKNGAIFLNLNAVVLANQDRLDDALVEVEKILNLPKTGRYSEETVFPYILKQIRENAEKNKNKDVLNKMEIIAKNIYKANILNSLDLPEYATRLKKIRIGVRFQGQGRQQGGQEDGQQGGQDFNRYQYRPRNFGYERSNQMNNRFEQGEQRLYNQNQNSRFNRSSRPLTPPPFEK